ncbi:hypothetical protein ACQPU1_01440 [Clostridium paraputrificum]|uniref:hypothetical protein n=1 Tax=Clostridium paraputrificum TaxID=29363 RepID=UPI003D351E31
MGIELVKASYVTRNTLERSEVDYRPFKEILDEELIKIGCNPTVQSKECNHRKSYEDIISPTEDTDNGEVYNMD